MFVSDQPGMRPPGPQHPGQAPTHGQPPSVDGMSAPSGQVGPQPPHPSSSMGQPPSQGYPPSSQQGATGAGPPAMGMGQSGPRPPGAVGGATQAPPPSMQAMISMQQKQNRITPVDKPKGLDPIDLLAERENRLETLVIQ